MVSLLVTALVVALSVSPQQGTAPPAVAIAVPPAGETQELLLKDGTRAIGRVETIEAESFTFRTTSGVVMKVDVKLVHAIGPVTGRLVRGEFWPEDSNPTRLFFAPTGRSLKRGDSYLGVYEILLPFVSSTASPTESRLVPERRSCSAVVATRRSGSRRRSRCSG